jgi:hypothetical protein
MAKTILVLNLRTAQAQKEVGDANFDATRNLFDKKILPLARHLSPREAQLHKAETVHNADSIQVRTKRTNKGQRASLFTTSGHGYYLELGTSKMPAQPSLRTAFYANLAASPET